LVFEKFGQVEAKKSGGVRSTGLGMTFCKMVIDSHDGYIGLSSEVGVGTTFWFTLPFVCFKEKSEKVAKEIEEKSLETVPESNYNKEILPYLAYQCFTHESKQIDSFDLEKEFTENPSAIKIMAVDDDLYSLRVYREFLCEGNFDFYYIQIVDILNTYKIAHNITPDIVLMDWEMPGTSGIEIIKQLKADDLTKDIPVIMVTSKSASTDIKIAFDAGASDYIHKPINKTEIITRTNFIIEFIKIRKPLVKQKSVQEKSINLYEANKLNILFAEDSFELRSYISACLREKYNVIEACNGQEGIDKAIAFQPDLIISDFNMPEVDGIEFCKQCRENFEISHIPFIILTANHNEGDMIQGYKYGIDDYILKPFSHNILFARIENLIKNRQELRKRYYSDLITNESVLCKNDKEIEFLDQLNKIIEENLSNSDFDIEECIKITNLSRTTLYRKLQAITGLSFNIYVRTIRLKHAAQLLSKGDKNITEISILTGFNSLSWFTRCFVEQFGVPPSEFTKLNTKS